MTSATPKPRAGEHTKGSTVIKGPLPGEAVERARLAGDYEAVPGLVNLVAILLDNAEHKNGPPVLLRQAASAIKTLEAERDSLTARNGELREALEKLVELGDHVPVFQLDDGKSSVKAVRLAGKFMGVMAAARALLAKHGR